MSATRLPDETIAQLVSNVTTSMLGLKTTLAKGAGTPTEHIMLLPIGSPEAVSVGLSSTVSSMRILAAAMFRCKQEELDKQMLTDSLGELLNMTAGLIKTTLALDMALGLPQNVQTQDVRLQSSRVVQLKAGEAILAVFIIE